MRTLLLKQGLLVGLSILLGGQVLLAQQTVLDEYVQHGLENNIVMQQKNISLDRALLALKTAKSMYLPTIAFQTTYQSGDGGRDIPLPLGDLLNGAYATLNQLTGTQNFPQLKNESINFFPKNFYDAKVRTSMPLFNKDIDYNKQVSERQVHLQAYEVDTYKRELVKNIKQAYYDYLKALQGIEIQESALKLAKEGKRVNEKLLENGKGLPAYVLRSESEVTGVEAQLSQARKQAENARMYFNMLLNQPAEESVEVPIDQQAALDAALLLLQRKPDAQGREELKSLAEYVQINETVLKMDKGWAIPKLSGFVDLGSQSQNWKFNEQSRYYMVGVQLDIPIFSGGRNRLKVKETSLALQDAQLNLQQAGQQLNLSSRVAQNNLSAAWDAYQSSLKQLAAAESYQRLIERGYQAGSNTYIETIDARNQLTTAKLALNGNKFNVLQAAASVERETAAYSLTTKNN
ncbi:Outer membrane protein TolC [bacterium A37T11]|nr:Outer membrane protein TolC [bacterium A37T11]